MKKIVAVLIAVVMVLSLVACGEKTPTGNPTNNPGNSTNPDYNLEELANSIIEDADIGETALIAVEQLISDEYSEIEMGITSKDKVVDNAVKALSPFGSIPVFFGIVKVNNKNDVESLKQEIVNNIDLRRWICVAADVVYAVDSGDYILFVYGTEDFCKAIMATFDAKTEVALGKAVSKSGQSTGGVGGIVLPG